MTNQLLTSYQHVCYLLKNTTIPCEYYLHYPVHTTYNNVSNPLKLVHIKLCKFKFQITFIEQEFCT